MLRSLQRGLLLGSSRSKDLPSKAGLHVLVDSRRLCYWEFASEKRLPAGVKRGDLRSVPEHLNRAQGRGFAIGGLGWENACLRW